MREPRPPKDQPSSNRPPTSGWWYLLAPGLLAVGALAAGTLALVALAAAGRSVADQQVIPVADTAVLEVGTPGEFVVFARYGTSVGGQAVDEPQVVVLDPDGRGLTLDGPDPVQTWSDGDEELVAIGNLTTTSSGPRPRPQTNLVPPASMAAKSGAFRVMRDGRRRSRGCPAGCHE